MLFVKLIMVGLTVNLMPLFVKFISLFVDLIFVVFNTIICCVYFLFVKLIG